MDYDLTWSELNARLRQTEMATGGLTAVLAELETHQRETGFIKDDLSSVVRYVFYHPGDHRRFFRVQFNPRRALRFNGSGVKTPPAGVDQVNGGCFLCRENIRWQQQYAQVGFEIEMTGDRYHALMNPFPLMPNHVVIAADDHVTQEWDRDGLNGMALNLLLADLCDMAKRLPGHIGFYNGVDAGASISGHLHFQFFRRPAAGSVFPLESWAFPGSGSDEVPVWARNYPIPVARWQGGVGDVVDAATTWLRRWVAANKDHVARLSSNFIVAADGNDGAVSLYFAPRDRSKPAWGGATELVGGLEILGEMVFSGDDRRKLLDDGAVDYFFVEKALAGVRPPFSMAG